MRRLSQIVGTNGDGLNGIDYSDHINVVVLAAGVAKDLTIPAGADYVQFNRTANFYARYGAAAALPAADVTDGSGAELNPGLRCIRGLTKVSIISRSACEVTCAFYSGQ